MTDRVSSKSILADAENAELAGIVPMLNARQPASRFEIEDGAVALMTPVGEFDEVDLAQDTEETRAIWRAIEADDYTEVENAAIPVHR